MQVRIQVEWWPEASLWGVKVRKGGGNGDNRENASPGNSVCDGEVCGAGEMALIDAGVRGVC